LLQAGAGLEQRLPGDVTVLMLAAALGLPDLCARLLQAGANVHATDAQGLTPLHCAVLFGFTARERPRLLALLDTLLLAGADADASAAGGGSRRTPRPGAPATGKCSCPRSGACSTRRWRWTCRIRAASARCAWRRCTACCGPPSGCCAPAATPTCATTSTAARARSR